MLTNLSNTMIGSRSFGSDSELVGGMVVTFVNGLEEKHVSAVCKHFPGYGNASEDSHAYYAYSGKAKDELYACELIPFQQALESGARMMTEHISLPNVTGDDIPASLNHAIVHDLLREELGFEGIIITDALNMGAVTEQYGGTASIMAVQAGTDMILMPADAYAAYTAVLAAVQNGEITEAQVNESVERIINEKTDISN